MDGPLPHTLSSLYHGPVGWTGRVLRARVKTELHPGLELGREVPCVWGTASWPAGTASRDRGSTMRKSRGGCSRQNPTKITVVLIKGDMYRLFTTCHTVF